jgi:hypothetical protein
MGHDYEDAVNPDQMTDEDVRDLVRQRLEESEEFDADSVDIDVVDGHIRVEGRVGTEGERQHVGQVMSALGLTEFENNVVVDPLARAERDEAADMARLEDSAATAGMGESGEATSDTAEHLRPNEAADLHGTRDVQEAIEGGRSYTPPDGPFQEGVGDEEQH